MKKRILIIDDDQILSLGTAKRLIKRGFEVELSHSGKEGLEKLNNEKFDMLLLDIKMPNMTGNEVLHEIRQKWEKNLLPVIMVSSCEGGDEIVAALKDGANDYIAKPIDIEILVARINTQMEIQNLSAQFAIQKESRAVSAIITTYNHEINNPLTIAFGILGIAYKQKKVPEDVYQKLLTSITRIKDIVKKIDKVTDQENVNMEEYTKETSMIKLG